MSVSYSDVICARASILVRLILRVELKSIAVNLSVSSPLVEAIIESFPGISSVAIVVGLVRVKLLYVFHVFFEQIEVESNLSFHLSTIEKEKELWFIPGIEVEF